MPTESLLESRVFQINFLEDLSDESLLEEVRRVASLSESGVPLTKDLYRKMSPRVSPKTLRKRFGDWEDVLRRAGLSHRYSGVVVTKTMKDTPKSFSKTELIQELRRVHGVVGKDCLTRSDYSLHSHIGADHFVRHFGGFLKGLEAAGIPRHPKQGKEYSDEECFENIANLWIHYGRAPQYRETLLPPSQILAKTYVTRWQTWRKALLAFVEWSKTDQTPLEDSTPTATKIEVRETNSKPKKHEADCREVRPGLKYQVHKRDSFRCVACGRSPATHLNIDLHADHIIAVANGGKTVLENLQTLCRDCNLGKGKSQ